MLCFFQVVRAIGRGGRGDGLCGTGDDDDDDDGRPMVVMPMVAMSVVAPGIRASTGAVDTFGF